MVGFLIGFRRRVGASSTKKALSVNFSLVTKSYVTIFCGQNWSYYIVGVLHILIIWWDFLGLLVMIILFIFQHYDY